MAYGDWEEVMNTYRDHFLNSKYSSHAQAMIELIPILRESLTDDTILPGTSLATLVLHVPDKKVNVNIWYEADSGYNIYLYHPMKGEIEAITVKKDAVLAAIDNFLQKARDYT